MSKSTFRGHLRSVVVSVSASPRRFTSTVMVGLLVLAAVAGPATPARAGGHSLTFSRQPPSVAVSGAAFDVTVELVDESRVPVAGAVVSVSIGSGGGTLGGTLTATTGADGSATFGLSITGVAGERTLTFTVAGLATVTSNPVTIIGVTKTPASDPPSVPPSVSCAPLPLAVGASVSCTVTGGDPGIDILWRAADNPPFAGQGVTLDADGVGTFGFTVPAAALGQVVTVELVDWLAPVSLGVVGGPVPTSVPSGGGPVPVWSLVLLALAGGLVLRRMSAVGVRG